MKRDSPCYNVFAEYEFAFMRRKKGSNTIIYFDVLKILSPKFYYFSL